MYVAVNLMSAIIHSQSNYGTVIIMFDGVNYIFYSFASNLCTAIFRNQFAAIHWITERRTRRLSPVDKRHEEFLVSLILQRLKLINTLYNTFTCSVSYELSAYK